MQLDLASIASLIDAGKGQNGYFASQLEESFAPFFDKLQNIKQDKRQIDINNLFNMDQQTSERFRRKYHNALKVFLNVFGKKISQLQSASISDLLFNNTGGKGSPSKINLPQSGINTPTPKKEKDGIEFKEDATKVHIESVSDGILDKLSSMNPTINQTNISGEGESKEGGGKSKSLLAKIFGGIMLASATAIGAYLLREGFLSDGKFKGFLKLAGMALLKPFLNLFKKDGLIGKFIARLSSPKFIKNAAASLTRLPLVGKVLFKPLFGLLKFAGKGAKIVFRGIPFLGTIISFAFAYSRFKAGDNLAGLMEIGAGLASLIPGIGWMISGAIGILLMARDLTTTKEDRENGSLGMFDGIKKYLMKIPLVKSISNFFGGLYLFFTAKNGSDMDRAFMMIEDSNISGLLPFMSPIFLIVKMLKNGIDVDTVMGYYGSVGKFLWGIAEKFWMFFYHIGDWMRNLLSNFLNSKTGQIFKLKSLNLALKLNLGVTKVMDYISNLLLSFLKSQYDKLNESFIGRAVNYSGDLVTFGWWGDKVDELGDALTPDTNQAKYIQDEIEKNNKKAKDLELSLQKDREMWHKESLQSNAENTAAIVNAANGTTAAVVGSRNVGGNTTFLYNSDGRNGLRRAKDRGFRQIYRNDPEN